MEKDCKDNQIKNPISKRCVNKFGRIGKKLMIDNENINIKWENNSCYSDSLLISLFHNKDLFIEKELLNAPLIKYHKDDLDELALKIKNELKKIYEIISMRKNDMKTCANLRKLLSDFYKKLVKYYPNKKILEDDDNWMRSQLDVFDFYNLLDKIFDMKKSLIFKEGSNKNSTDFSYMIPIDLLINKRKVFIKKIIPTYILINNKIKKEITVLKGNKLFLKIFRNLGDYKLETMIIPPKILKLPKNSFNLHLTSIIIHYGSFQAGHYICLYNLNGSGMWFEYDDLKNKSVYIGNLSKIIKDENYISNIVGLIYSK